MRVSKTKALISIAVTAKLICFFAYAYADCWFSNAAAQMLEKSTLCHGLRPKHSRQYEHVRCCLLSAYFRMKSVSDALSNTQKMTLLHVYLLSVVARASL